MKTPLRPVRLAAVVLAVSASSVLFVAGCSKKDGEGGGASTFLSRSEDASPARSHALLTYLPASAAGFYLMDYSLPSAEKFMTSPWNGKESTLSETVKGFVGTNQEADQALALMTELEADGLIPSPKSQGKLTSLLATVSLEASGEASAPPSPAIAVFEEFIKAEDVAAKITAIGTRAKSKGITAKPLPVEGGAGIVVDQTVTLPGEGGGEVKTSIILAGRGSRLILATSPALIDPQFLAGEPSRSTRFTELKEDPEYKRAQASIPSHDAEFAFAYADIKGTIGRFAAGTPEAAKIPFTALVVAREMDKSLVDRGGLLLKTGDPAANAGLDGLKSPSATTLINQLPGELVTFISIDGAIAKAVVGSALESTPADQKASIEPFAETIRSVQELGIAIRAQQMASPLPEIALIIQSTQATDIASMISSMISSGAGSQGFLSPFQKKDVQGVPVEYAVSPFGPGVFLGVSGDQVLLSTSEGILSELINGKKNLKGLALEGLSSESTELLGAKDALASVHVNYARVATLIQTMSASLGLFTGGKPLVEEKELTRLTAFGQTSAAVRYADNALLFNTRTELPAKK